MDEQLTAVQSMIDPSISPFGKHIKDQAKKKSTRIILVEGPMKSI